MEDIKKINPALLSIISIIVFAISFIGAPYIFAQSAFDFSLSNGGAKSVGQGSSVSNTITTTLTAGTPAPVSFNVSGLPPDSAASFSPASCTPSSSGAKTCTPTPTITISTGSSTPAGVYPITVVGTSKAPVSSEVAGIWNLTSTRTYNSTGACYLENTCSDISGYVDPSSPEWNRGGTGCSSVGATAKCITNILEFDSGCNGPHTGRSFSSIRTEENYTCVAI